MPRFTAWAEEGPRKRTASEALLDDDDPFGLAPIHATPSAIPADGRDDWDLSQRVELDDARGDKSYDALFGKLAQLAPSINSTTVNGVFNKDELLHLLEANDIRVAKSTPKARIIIEVLRSIKDGRIAKRPSVSAGADGAETAAPDDEEDTQPPDGYEEEPMPTPIAETHASAPPPPPPPPSLDPFEQRFFYRAFTGTLGEEERGADAQRETRSIGVQVCMPPVDPPEVPALLEPAGLTGTDDGATPALCSQPWSQPLSAARAPGSADATPQHTGDMDERVRKVRKMLRSGQSAHSDEEIRRALADHGWSVLSALHVLKSGAGAGGSGSARAAAPAASGAEAARRPAVGVLQASNEHARARRAWEQRFLASDEVF